MNIFQTRDRKYFSFVEVTGDHSALKPFSLRLFMTTDTELNPMAPPAITGLRVMPKDDKVPAAIGTPMTL